MRKIALLVSVLILCIFSIAAKENNSASPESDYPYLLKLYKHLHSHPELCNQEKGTSKRIADELEKLGFEVTRNVGGYGVVGVFRNGKGPTVMIRTDMDALPITEETGLSYASKAKGKYKIGDQDQEVGVMHACGHDMHMTVFVGTARQLMRRKGKWHGTLVMIGQPAEEPCTGAKAMIDDGLFTRFPRPDCILGLHVMPFPTGLVGCRKGYWFASETSLDVIIHGIGGSAHTPQMTKDPVIIAAQIVTALQTIVSREVDPQEPAVVTVGAIHGGVDAYTIPEKVLMKVDIRAFPEELRKKMINSVKRIVEETAKAFGVPETLLPTAKQVLYAPPLYNDPELTKQVVGVLEKTLGKDSVIKLPLIMGAEDFARYGTVEPKIPTCFFGIGAVNPEFFEKTVKKGESVPGLHNPRFAPDPESTIKTGVTTMFSVVLDLFRKSDNTQ